MFPYKSLFEICRLLSYRPTNLKFCLTFCHLYALNSHPAKLKSNSGFELFFCFFTLHILSLIVNYFRPDFISTAGTGRYEY